MSTKNDEDIAKKAEESPASAAPPAVETDDESEEEESVAATGTKDNQEVADYDDAYMAISGDFALDLKLIKQIPCPYVDIIAEFADVEVFMISIDSMLLEFTAHSYHNWVLGGQTIVLAEQVDRFLNSLEDLDAKFKLVWFSDLSPLYQQDAYLSFLHPFIINYLKQSKWGGNLECFRNPMDERWQDYLHRLTPSFLIMSLGDASESLVKEKIDFASRFISLAVHLLTSSIPVVLFNGFTVNFSSVMAYRLSTIPISIVNMDRKISDTWTVVAQGAQDKTGEGLNVAVTDCKSAAEFWALVIAELIKRDGRSDDEFERFCCALLLSSLLCKKLGVARTYPASSKGPSPASNQYRRRLLSAAMLAVNSHERLDFPLRDLWDGRMILALHHMIADKKEVLPFRLQEEFASLHQMASLKFSLPTDVKDSLLDTQCSEDGQRLLIDDCKLFPVKSGLLQQFVPEMEEIFAPQRLTSEDGADIAAVFEDVKKWKFRTIEEKLIEFAEKKPPTDPRELRKFYRKLLKQSAWNQNFADSLEGRGTDLVVDFSREKTLSMATGEDGSAAEAAKNGERDTGKSAGGKGKQKKAGAKAKEPQLSKREQILKANRENMKKKQVESDQAKINFATQVKGNAIVALDAVFRRLELSESKALCMYEKVKRLVEAFNVQIARLDNTELKRDAALEVVAAIKTCLLHYWAQFTEEQKNTIKSVWIGLGFGKNDPGRKLPVDRRYNLGINLVYYQLHHGGRIIDVLSDPQKDDRVVGFSPDAWQRRMLDAVDQDKSALIIAPTSAGKTFVSYYCIERVLRRSDDEVVVYVSPSKALMNQVVGSVYARFRNKPMHGGKVLYGTYNNEWGDNCMNCQVLITIPECFEAMLTSPDPRVQQFCARIRYVILDEVHCINATQGLIPQGHIWEHIFLLIRCPFLALSATVENVEVFHAWLQSVESTKAVEGEKPNEVARITYDERWSELELAINKMRFCPPEAVEVYRREYELFMKKANKTAELAIDSAASSPEPGASASDLTSLPDSLLQNFNPYGVYQAEKIRMFGIPLDQKLTARQALQLYTLMSEVDSSLRQELEPCKFFHYDVDGGEPVWLNRDDLRKFEDTLRERFLSWLENDPQKSEAIFKSLGDEVRTEFGKRSKPFNMRASALHNIVATVDELRRTDRLPALCFNDDRYICEQLAVRVFNQLDKREAEYRNSPEFERRYNVKAEERAEKLEKRRRDEREKERTKTKKKKATRDEAGNVDGGRYEKEDAREDDIDELALQKLRLKAELERFKLRGRITDEDIYEKTKERLMGKAQSKERSGKQASTLNLLRLFERGIGYHHDGMTAYERGSVEILFRAGFLGIVFSTSTLALGMNMPCKTVLFGIDTPKLTPLQFRQMSGRAGRRGFDPAGTVAFMSLPASKIRRLLTASLAILRGNIPYTTAFTLHLLNYVKGEDEKDFDVSLPKGYANRELKTTDVTRESIREKAALTLLQSPFALHTIHEHVKEEKLRLVERDKLKTLLRFLTLFNVQLLRSYQLLDEKCCPKGFAHIACYLRGFEAPGLLFTVLLRSGVFHRLLAKIEEKSPDERNEIKVTIVNVLAHVFTNKPCWYFDCEDGDVSSQPVLKPPPAEVAKLIDEYNGGVDRLLTAFLQLSAPNKKVQSPVFELSGSINELSVYKADIVTAFDEDLNLDRAFIPGVAYDIRDHRGRKIYRNSFAVDFWKNGDRRSLVEYNKLPINEIWYLCNEFHKALRAIARALQVTTIRSFVAGSKIQEERISNDPVTNMFVEIAREFNIRFKKGFGMSMRDDEDI